MTAKEHYEQHLGSFYSWMAGDFDEKLKEQERFFLAQNIKPESTALVIDLGAGHGIQSVSLAKLGFKVKAVDFNSQLLRALTQNSDKLNIEVIDSDIRSFNKYTYPKPELIICWGDTLTHLNNSKEIEQLLTKSSEALTKNGKLILSFRDYSDEMIGNSRFIPVKSDESRIFTCFLEYTTNYVTVSDLLYEKEQTGWKQKVSSYNKVRISTVTVIEYLTKSGMKITFNQIVSQLTTIIAVKE